MCGTFESGGQNHTITGDQLLEIVHLLCVMESNSSIQSSVDHPSIQAHGSEQSSSNAAHLV